MNSTNNNSISKLPSWTFEKDLEFIISSAEEVFSALRGARIFVTGGTGFIGTWFLETLRYANETLDLSMRVTILSRNGSGFGTKAPHLITYPNFTFIPGDVCTFSSPLGQFTHIVHAATDASADLNENNPLRMFNTVLQGTQRVLDFAVEKNIERVLFLSSGAVYGRQPWGLSHISEDSPIGPNCGDYRSAYAEGKRAAEMLCAIYKKQFDLNIVIARIFSLLGPYLSLGTHFAAGNFIRDAMNGNVITINGNGLPCRSYLYAADLIVWLLHMLVRADAGQTYNVGSDESISVKELADRISAVLGNVGVKILGAPDNGWNPGRYVPSTDLISHELGLRKTVSLDDAILRTAIWNGWKGKSE